MENQNENKDIKPEKIRIGINKIDIGDMPSNNDKSLKEILGADNNTDSIDNQNPKQKVNNLSGRALTKIENMLLTLLSGEPLTDDEKIESDEAYEDSMEKHEVIVKDIDIIVSAATFGEHLITRLPAIKLKIDSISKKRNNNNNNNNNDMNTSFDISRMHGKQDANGTLII